MRCAPTWSEMRTIFSQPLQSLVEYLPHAWVELLEAFFLEICLDMKNIASCSIIILLQDAEVRLSYFDFCSHSVCLVSSAPLDSFPPVLAEGFTRALPLICDPRLHRCTFPIHRLNPSHYQPISLLPYLLLLTSPVSAM